MRYLGEIISLGVAFSWTIAALTCEIASRKLGVVVTNVWRMLLALVLSMALMWVVTGSPLPVYAHIQAWLWLLLSGVVGYFFGDWCLFNSYITIGSRYGQLFMTLAPMFTAIAAWAMLGQVLDFKSLIAMIVTMSGIAISVFGRGGKGKFTLELPLKGVLYGIGAGLGQGLGLVLSKIGMDYYMADIPAQALPQLNDYLPFGANLIRCIAGLICYLGWLLARGGGKKLAGGFESKTAAFALILAVLSGPFIGVGFSLMAVQYTQAGIASTIMATTPIIILVPSYYLFKQKITVKSVIGAVISVIGVSIFFI